MPSQSLQIQLSDTAAVAVYPPGAVFGPRHLVDYEFVWIIEGDVEYCWNKTTMTAPPGTLLLCRPPAIDSFCWDKHHFTRHAYFHFKIHQIPTQWPSPDDWPLSCLPQTGDLLRLLFSHLLHNGRELPQDQTLLTAELLLTAFISGHHHASQPPPSQLPEAVQDVFDFIRQTLSRDSAASFTLTQLAKIAFVTPEHLCRLFREQVGFAPMQTVRLIRLENALQLVARTNYPLVEIAHRCGFAGANHFSRCFAQTYRSTPSQIRKNTRQGAALPPSPLTQTKR